jgi:hypothetical protein
MTSIRVSAIVQADGEVHFTELPCRAGDEVEAILFLPAKAGARLEAKARFLARAGDSRLSSGGSYPTRDELHERH